MIQVKETEITRIKEDIEGMNAQIKKIAAQTAELLAEPAYLKKFNEAIAEGSRILTNQLLQYFINSPKIENPWKISPA